MLIQFITFGENPAVVIARERGLFAAHGIEVETIVTRSSTQQMRGLSDGTYDVASTAFDNVLAWSGREGADIHAVARASERMGLPVYVRPEIGDWEDLRGRLLAVDAVDTAYALVLRRILLAHGLDMLRGDYELDPVGATGPRFESMKSGKTFAGILNPPWDHRAEAEGMRRIADYREVLPNYPGGVFAVTTAWAAAHRRELVDLLKCLAESTAWGNDPANRAEARGVLRDALELDEAGAAKELSSLPATTELDVDGLQVPLDLRVSFELPPGKGADLAVYYDPRYHAEAAG
ncbi:MAG: ABC transporter substrate-binding protein [Deltaproteobacteria bacterium]|nr:ABC transporter substrate-binding protein [Deltaproteobacteria bacterium]